MKNETLIRIGVIIGIVFALWIAYLVIVKLKGKDIINKGEIYEYIKR